MTTDPRLGELDSSALGLLVAGRVEAAVPSPADFADADFSGHAWAAVVVASALATTHRVSEAESLLADAHEEFSAGEDRRGLGWVAQVRATIALGRGQLDRLAEHLADVAELLAGDESFPSVSVARLGLVAFHAGDVRQAVLLAEKALALARTAGHRRDEGVALAYLAFFEFWRGRFARVEHLLDAAEDTYADTPELDGPFELPVATGLRGALHAVRGQIDAAEEQYARALRVAAKQGMDWYEAIVLAQRAYFLGAANPRRSRTDARRSYDRLVEMGDEWWQVWALRAQGTVETALGNHAAAEALLRRALDQSAGPQERALTLIALGHDRLELGDSEGALDLLTEGIDCARQADVGFIVAWAAALLARAQPAHADDWFRLISEQDDGDVAYDLLLATDLRIVLLGDTGVWRGAARVPFATRHAETALFCLALDEHHTLHEEILVERLWPDAPADRVAGRLGTLVWQIRRGLGPDSWRLRRQHDLVRLDCRGLDVDVVALRTTATRLLTAAEVNVPVARETVAALSRPLLPGLQYEGWVQEPARQLAAIASRLEALIADHRSS